MAANSVTIPTSVDGWGYDFPFDAMPPTTASILTNMIVETGRLRVRKGYEPFSTIIGSAGISSKIGILKKETGNVIVVAGATAISTNSFGVSTVIESGYTNAFWQLCSFRSYLFFVRYDHSDGDPQELKRYDGTSYVDPSFTIGGSSSFDVSHISSHKGRLHCICKISGEINLYYAGPNSVTGALTLFDVTSIFQHGGYPLGTASLSRTTQAGDESQLAVFSSEGEVLIYNGTGPSDYVLVRRARLPKIIRSGRQTDSWTQFNDDLIILTEGGVFSLNSVLNGDSSPIFKAANNYIAEIWESYYNYYYGPSSIVWTEVPLWTITYYSSRQTIIVNMSSGPNREQLIINMRTGAISLFKFLPAAHWAEDGLNLYFVTQGNPGYLRRAWTGTTDNSVPIAWEYGTPWTLLENKNRKTVNGLLPSIKSEANDVITLYTDTDLKDSLNGYTTRLQANVFLDNWVPVMGTGKRFRFRITGSTSSDVELSSIEALVTTGASK
jgi:hypothetical protein